MNWIKDKLGKKKDQENSNQEPARLEINPNILIPESITPEKQKQVQLDHKKRTKDFIKSVQDRGLGNVEDLNWYHCIDLGDGLTTPGVFDYSSQIDRFEFPEDMSGLSVLDVGSSTGFFTFEFARRGGNVTSVDACSVTDFDYLRHVDHKRILKGHIKYEMLWEDELLDRVFDNITIEQLDELYIKRPYDFCKEVLKADVKRVHTPIYELNAEVAGQEQFDYVFVGNILLHLQNPLLGLAAVAPLCKNMITIIQPLPHVPEDRPVMVFQGGDEWNDDNITWWLPNVECFRQMLGTLGFKKFEVVNGVTGITQTLGNPYSHTIIRAWKQL